MKPTGEDGEIALKCDREIEAAIFDSNQSSVCADDVEAVCAHTLFVHARRGNFSLSIYEAIAARMSDGRVKSEDLGHSFPWRILTLRSASWKNCSATDARRPERIPMPDLPEHPDTLRPEAFAVFKDDKMKSTLFESDRILVGLNCFEPQPTRSTPMKAWTRSIRCSKERARSCSRIVSCRWSRGHAHRAFGRAARDRDDGGARLVVSAILAPGLARNRA